jgi:hypothetical protein
MLAHLLKYCFMTGYIQGNHHGEENKDVVDVEVAADEKDPEKGRKKSVRT